jgi:hypothetical protein
MAQKDESILNLLVECPWWVGLEKKNGLTTKKLKESH